MLGLGIRVVSRLLLPPLRPGYRRTIPSIRTLAAACCRRAREKYILGSRQPGARHSQPADPRLAHYALYRDAGCDHCADGGIVRGHRGRLRRRLGRCRADAHHRYLSGFPAVGAGPCLRGRARRRYRERGARHLADRMAALRADRPGRDADHPRTRDFIHAVRLQGAGPLRIITRHIWPLCISSLMVRVTLDMAGIILAAAGLGFLGLGAQPPTPEWGAMISEGRRFILGPLVGRHHARAGDLYRVPGFQPVWATDCATCSTPRRDRVEQSFWTSKISAREISVTGAAYSRRSAESVFLHPAARNGWVSSASPVPGKSVTGRAILQVDPAAGDRVEADRMDLGGRGYPSHPGAGDAQTCAGQSISMVMQDPEVLAEPGDARRRPDIGSLYAARQHHQSAGPSQVAWKCWWRSRSAIPERVYNMPIRTRFPAAWVSAS